MKGVQVLIADDDPDVRDNLALFFKSRGHQVRVARDGAEAWEMFNAKKPEVVVTDVMMPRLSGIDLCRKIRGTGVDNHIPIILLSVLSTQDEIVEGFEAGATDYVTKPYLNAEIIARTESAIRHVHLRQESSRGVELEEYRESLNRICHDIRPSATRLLGELRAIRMRIRLSDDYLKERLDLACQHAARILVILEKLRQVDASRIRDEAEA